MAVHIIANARPHSYKTLPSTFTKMYVSDNASVANILSYNATEEYGMLDLTPESFKDFVDR